MCNSCYNYRNCCCTSSTSHNCNGYCGARECPKVNYCYPRVENPNKCACCQQLRCKNNDLLHQLCPVPGTRGETMKKILLAEPPSKSPSTRMPKQTLPLLNYLGGDLSSQSLYESLYGNRLDVNLKKRYLLKYLGEDPSSQSHYLHNGNQLDVNLKQRLLERLLRTNTEAQLKTRAVAKKKQLSDMVGKMKHWYIKEMTETPGEPELGVYIIPGIPSGHHPQLSRSKSLLKLSFIRSSRSHLPMRSFIAGLKGEDDEVFVSNTNSDTSISSHMSIISLNVKPDMLSNPLEIDEVVALGDIRELLKQVQKKPTRPILFHSPFQRDIPWSWRNYDPLSDMPSTLKASTSLREGKSQYTPWTMNIVQELLTGNPVTDKKLKTNKELQGMINQLAFELKRRNELSYTKLRHPHQQRVHNRKRSSR